MRKILSVLIAAIGLLATSIFTASQASAATWEVNYGVDFDGSIFCRAHVAISSGIGTGCYENEGDKVISQDLEKDGLRMAVHWRLGDGSRRGLCINTGGMGARRWCNKDFIEGKQIQIRIGLCDGGSANCEYLANYTRWSSWSAYTPT